ncbi:yrdC domain-containing protein, mitochondrial [Neodiprion fabricii]|uniref:yrdC domain-containing protein, mitochondrial n=1 Tax=Neodiprion fabricii TaxID=2872261 RepID=UPI001ED95DC6|nr:yrdC domain-containing protein, mitochondrial [Neodiprion fabricii]
MSSDEVRKKTMGPVKQTLRSLETQLKNLHPGISGFGFAYGSKNVAMAVRLLQDKHVIALPTDTVYGLAGLAQSNESVKKLYEIKQRDPCKPLAICVGEIVDVKYWGIVDSLPDGLLEALFPGPVTLVLKRTPKLNPLFNPNVQNVGIRIPDAKFIRDIAKRLREPLALTSANESNKPSTIHPEEFSALWSHLGGVFYPDERVTVNGLARAGSTVVDLSQPGGYSIIRKGSAEFETVQVLKSFQLVDCDDKH